MKTPLVNIAGKGDKTSIGNSVLGDGHSRVGKAIIDWSLLTGLLDTQQICTNFEAEQDMRCDGLTY